MSRIINQKAMRIDGRKLLEHRDAQIQFGKNNGQVIVEMGNTRILCHTLKSLVTPNYGKASNGVYKFNINTHHLQAEEEFHFGSNRDTPLTETKVELSKFIEKVLIKSKAIDTESLCVINAKLVWCLTVEITVLSFDGNLIDPLFMAVILSLMTTKIPQIEILKGGDAIRVCSENEKPLKSLNVHHIPCCVTFYLLEQCDKNKQNEIIMDPTLKEEKLCEQRGRITYTMNVFGDLCGVHSDGNIQLDVDTIMMLQGVAEKQTIIITETIRQALKEQNERQIDNYQINQKIQQIPQVNIVKKKGGKTSIKKQKDINMQEETEESIPKMKKTQSKEQNVIQQEVKTGILKKKSKQRREEKQIVDESTDLTAAIKRKRKDVQ